MTTGMVWLIHHEPELTKRTWARRQKPWLKGLRVDGNTDMDIPIRVGHRQVLAGEKYVEYKINQQKIVKLPA
jgi:hypothetical protein